MTAMLEHTNYSVKDPHKTAAWMQNVFGWRIRWEGSAMNGAGYTVHVGTKDRYVALYAQSANTPSQEDNYQTIGSLNHIGIVVSDLAAVEENVKAAGFEPFNHADYEPGQRFYFFDQDKIEYEVVCYA
ncbi:MAG: VOC family protein [Aliishimia sp.]